MNDINSIAENIYSEAIEYFNKKNETSSLKKDDNAFKVFEEEVTILFNKYFRSSIDSAIIDVGGHLNGKYDGLTVAQIKEKFEYEHMSYRIEQFYEFAIGMLFYSLLDGDDKEKTITQFIRNLTGIGSNNVEVQCDSCGCTSRLYLQEGNKFSLNSRSEGMNKMKGQQPCSFPSKDVFFTGTLNVPSGKLIFVNDFRDLYTKEERDGNKDSINSVIGLKKNFEYWLSLGMIYIFTSNTSPSIFKNNVKGEVSIKSQYDYNPDTDEETANYTDDETYLGYICTDLWAACGMDYENFRARCEEKGISAEEYMQENSAVLVDLEPGLYQVNDLHNIQTERTDPFCIIKKI